MVQFRPLPRDISLQFHLRLVRTRHIENGIQALHEYRGWRSKVSDISLQWNRSGKPRNNCGTSPLQQKRMWTMLSKRRRMHSRSGRVPRSRSGDSCVNNSEIYTKIVCHTSTNSLDETADSQCGKPVRPRNMFSINMRQCHSQKKHGEAMAGYNVYMHHGKSSSYSPTTDG